MENRVQTFENHSRTDPYFLWAAFLVLATSLAALIAFVMRPGMAEAGQVLMSVALVLILLRLRRYALTLQDRIIRMETRQRFERVLSADLFTRFGELTLRQVIALRFASDEELPALFRSVVNREVTEPKEIKKRITKWQADWLRV